MLVGIGVIDGHGMPCPYNLLPNVIESQIKNALAPLSGTRALMISRDTTLVDRTEQPTSSCR